MGSVIADSKLKMNKTIKVLLIEDQILTRIGIKAVLKTHVKNILAKLQVSDRTAAATSAIKHGIVRVDY